MNIELANCTLAVMDRHAKIAEVKSLELPNKDVVLLHSISTFRIYCIKESSIIVASLNPLLLKFFSEEKHSVDFCLDYVNNIGVQSDLFA